MDSKTMEIAALGRSFSVGMLYDCRQDLLVPGITLWDSGMLDSSSRKRPKPNTEFEIVASESIEDKSSSLNVNASLKASFLGGLVDLEGSAKYLNDQKTSRNQARVTLTYKTTTTFQELSMDQLGRGNIKHQYVFDKGIATHVVTGILYGAQAFFIFDREVSQQENHQDIQGNMKVMIKKIPCLSIEGEGSQKIEDKDIANIEKFSCKFYGDFSLKKNPVSFQDAVEVYQSLPTLLGKNGENAVPVKVWLLPLTVLDSSAAKLVREISLGLVQEAQNVLEDFNDLEMRCNDLMQTTTAQQFPQINKKLKAFKDIFSEYKLTFQKKMAEKIPSIRGGEEGEVELVEVLRKRHSSPFNSKDLHEWMDCKEREIFIIQSFTNKMRNVKIIPSQNHLDKESDGIEHTVCFVFTSLEVAEPYLLALSNYLRGPASQHPQDPHKYDIKKEQWYTSKEVTDEMKKKALLFSDLAEANKDNKNIKFLVLGCSDETQKGSAIYLHDVFSGNENFEPPSKPETVTIVDIKHNSVKLKISPPKYGIENITSYLVEFCVCGEDEWLKQTVANAEEVTVNNLRPLTEYKFRCRAVTSAGVGPAKEVITSIRTACYLTLDPKTVSRRLLLSEGNRKVTKVKEQQSPRHPDRFDDRTPLVLSREPLIGCCYWELEWSGNTVTVGVAYKSASRSVNMGNTDKSWSLECYDDHYTARHNGIDNRLPASPSGSRRVRVYVNRETGTVSFYRVSSNTHTHLHTFNITHTDEPLHAMFCVWLSDTSVSLV